MISILWSHTLVLAGLVTVINAQCLSTNVFFRVNARPTSVTVEALNDVTLTCSPRSSLIRPTEYSWHRINGDIPSSSSGQNTDRLILRDVVPADEGEYYCMAVLLGNCARSDNVMVSITVSCPSLSNPSNGMINCSLGDDGGPSYEDTCSFTCNTGYELTGSESRTCQINGTWSGNITMCNRVSCPSLSNPSNGMIDCSLGDDGVSSYEDTCNFTCNTGYELTGSESRTCQSDGSWSGSTAMCNKVSCPSLNEPSNGIIKCSVENDRSLSYEDTCNFTCETGYELIGSESRTCQSDGSWSGSVAICNRVPCSSLSEPSNGVINCSLGDDGVPSYQDICSFTCNTGYELTGSERRTCQSNGSWSGNIAMCNRVSCPSLSEPSNGMINCSLGDDGVPSYEDTCGFTCDTGYELTGSESRTCQSDGSWSGNTAMCSRVSCPSLINPSNGMINCSLGDDGAPSYEDICSFTCNTGYEVTGSESRTCQSDGSWSGINPVCSRVSCPSLSEPSNGMILCSLGDDGVPSYEDTCNFTCNTGYELTGSESRTCQSDGSWSGINAVCSRVSCPSLSDPSNGMINCSLGDDGVPSYEDTCSFTCNTGYELTGSESRTCQSDGSWSGSIAMCNRVSCSSLSEPSNGMINCSLGDDGVPSYEDICSFTCNTGYELTGSESRTCLSDGSWSGNIAVCIRVSCPSLSEPSNGIIDCTIENDRGPSYEDICSFTCNTGYELTGSESRTCQSDGSWSGSVAMCVRVSCPSLSDPSNGIMNCSLGDDEVPSYEDTCSFTCNIGYELTGSESRTCQSNGSWSGSNAVCSRVSCPSLSEPSNGAISCSLGDDGAPSYEDTCSFTCNTGYELTGSESRTCQSDGSWNGSIAACSRISCPSLSEPSNGTILCSLGDDGVPSYEDTCNFTCSTGYELTGSDSRTCQSNGSWSGNITRCNRISCSIKGQVLTIDCFGNNATCSNPNPSVICDVPQCACPKGQVIDEAKSACIDGAKCRGGCKIRKISAKARYSNFRKRLTLSFSANGQGKDASFQCKIDDQKFSNCTSKVVWRNLSLQPGRHTVTVSGRCIYNGGTTSTASSEKSFLVLF